MRRSSADGFYEEPFADALGKTKNFFLHSLDHAIARQFHFSVSSHLPWTISVTT